MCVVHRRSAFYDLLVRWPNQLLSHTAANDSFELPKPHEPVERVIHNRRYEFGTFTDIFSESRRVFAIQFHISYRCKCLNFAIQVVDAHMFSGARIEAGKLRWLRANQLQRHDHIHSVSGIIVFIVGVAAAARVLGVSPHRVRALISEG